MPKGIYIRTMSHRIKMSNTMRKGKSIEESFLNKVRFNYKCWNWIASKTPDGHGNLGMLGKIVLAHRYSYEMFNGKIYKNNEIHHICENPSCVNPGHLEQLTNKQHILIGNGVGAINSRKIYCKRGHLLPEINNNKRRCKQCRRIRKD